jgi:DNA-binding NarL/FixJ family response regulator
VEECRPRLLIADDYEPTCELINALSQQLGHFDIVGKALSGPEAIQKTRILMPDAVLMDFAMPEMNGVEATITIHSEFPKIKVIGLSIHEELEVVQAMLRAGAVQFISKNRPWEEIISMIDQVCIAAD